MKKKRIISFFTLIVLCFLFSGCFDNNAAKTSAERYCSLIFKSDLDNTQKLGISESEKDDLVNKFKDKIKEQLKHNLLLMGYSASDDQLNLVSDGYKEALSKITYNVKQISKSGDEAEVEISTNHFDIKEIDEKAAMDALDETEDMRFTIGYEENKKFSEIYLNKLAEGLKNVEVSSEQSKNTFKFKKENNHWIPDDSDNFGYKLVKLATNNKNPDLNINEESISPEESAKVFWDLVIKSDSTSIEKIGYSKAFGERIIKTMNKSELESLKKEFKQSGVSPSDDQIQGIVDALRSAISQNSVDFEVVSKTDTTAEVKISATSINLDSIVNDVSNETRNQIISSRMTDKQKAVELYCRNLVDSIKNVQVGSTKSEQIFNFSKIADMWMPTNVEKFFESIGKLNIQ
ncbi:DUF5105 domain-containing protein [Clostridium weizhouense]|uniref:DUF5105 domain-containing protein n=1 Tax=Clostridium weizhouense TaxID=2859781 RepID=A0ABS7AJ49_9CLOT|nr:DUF5105 domain-containing protein [Clostridium weizhouense]MBW6408689.1 DUF5105 domain-containing protein [Clostridium weizhouense]